MDGLDAARRHIRLAAGLAIALVVIGLGLLCAVYEYELRESGRQQARASVGDRLDLVASALQSRIDVDIQLVRGIVAILGADPDLDVDRFHRMGGDLLNGRDEARMIAIAPDRVVSMIYPEEDNRAAIGFEFPASPIDPWLLEAGAHRIALIGPARPRIGGEVFFARAAVFVGEDQRFWGFVSLLIDAPTLFRAAGLDDPALDVAIERTSGPDAGRLVFGDAVVFANDPVATQVKIPGGEWRLAATPRGGWTAPAGLWMTRAVFAVIGATLVGGVIATARLVVSRQRQLAIIRRREGELSQLSWRLEFALASSNIGVWDVDLATDELYWDARTKALFGRQDDERPFYGLDDWMSVVHPDDRTRAVAEADAAATGNGRFSSRYRVVLPDGTVRHIRDVACVHAAEDGSRRLVGLVWDVTEEVLRQEELEVRRIEAEAATTAKSRFLATMSHEIRTPMSGVLGVLGLMLDDPLPPQQRERARIALASAESLLEILNDILDFSKLEAAQVALGEEPFEIRSLVAQVMELMSPNATRKGLSISHRVSAAVPRFVIGDPVRVRQIMTNFLSNATKFTDRGEIAVRVDYSGPPAGGILSIEVEDTGIGVAPEHRDVIFDRFIQAEDSLTRRTGGAGLGLAISSQLAELMGGQVSLRSVRGMGSTFRLAIPTRAGVAGEGARAPRPDTGAMAPMRVLLAEDHTTNQYVISAYLHGAGHEVTLVGNGAEAVRAVREGDFDVVLMDVQMPVMDGLAAAAAIRALGGPAAQVPILALTASAMPGDRAACLAAGMNDHLTKPITAASLFAALREVAGRQPAAADDEALRTGTSA